MSIYNGNCLELLRMLPDNSVDSIVTDPPYGLSFMGKKWDYDVPSVEIWAECLRVLKPGGHMLAFAGTRTQHRMAVRIEDAGFEIRDMIAWVYGSGFPKSLDVSKALDKAAGAEREVIGIKLTGRANAPRDEGRNHSDCAGGQMTVPVTAPATPAAQQWQGWGTALKPALEPITVARKPLTGTVADNVLRYGTGAINIDGCRVALPEGETISTGFAESKKAGVNNAHDGWQRPWQQNVEYHADKINAATDRSNDLGRWPANLMHDGSDEVLGAFPSESSTTGKRKDVKRVQEETGSTNFTRGVNAPEYTDSGSPARFFYCPKASKSDRNYGCENLPDTSAADMVDRTADSDGMNSPRAGAGRTSGAKNNHPTVKPIALMRYLCRLVTPPGGVVLDPFTGSGSTGVAATLEGFNFLGAEMDANFHTIASARLNQARTDSGAPTLITLIEYTTSDSKPTGRICRLLDTSREQLSDLLMLYGFTGAYSQYTGRMENYHPMYWCFVYQGSMGHHPGEPVDLSDLIS